MFISYDDNDYTTGTSGWVVGGRTAAVLLGVASRTRSVLLAAFLCNCRQVFSPCV